MNYKRNALLGLHFYNWQKRESNAVPETIYKKKEKNTLSCCLDHELLNFVNHSWQTVNDLFILDCIDCHTYRETHKFCCETNEILYYLSKFWMVRLNTWQLLVSKYELPKLISLNIYIFKMIWLFVFLSFLQRGITVSTIVQPWLSRPCAC